MSTLTIDPDVIRWTVRGAAASPEVALAALAEQPLLVLMHGLGSNEADLISLVPALPLGFVCAALRAPMAMPQPYTGGFTWFPASLQQSDAAPDSVTENAAWQAAQSVLEWLDGIDAALVAAGSSPARCAVMGFSQGGVMSTSLLRTRPQRFVAAVNCSGFTAPGEFPGDAELASLRPPVFWGRDVHDPVIGFEAVARTQSWLPEHSALTVREYPGIGHSISLDELDDVFVFLSREVPGAVPIR